MKDKYFWSGVRSEVIDYFNEDWEDLQTSLLTKSLRNYLLGRDDFEGRHATQKENQKRMRLRKRIEQGIIDFALFSKIKEKDRSLIFSNLSEEDVAYIGFVELIAFIYLGMREVSADFSLLVREGIFLGEARSPSEPGQKVDDVNVDIDVNYQDELDIDEILKRLMKEEPISREEFAELVLSKSYLFQDHILNEVEITDGKIRIEQSTLGTIARKEYIPSNGANE